MTDDKCISCGKPKDTYTKKCSECLHKHRRYYYLAKGRFDLASEVSDRPYAVHWLEDYRRKKEAGKC